ncbi:MAG: sugar phosphate nucleotidyltransferase, partial [bacterium]
FANYFLHMADVTFDMEHNTMEVHNKHAEPWKVTLVDTGTNTMTGGRIKRIQPYIGNEPFMVTYGDGVADVDIKLLVDTHNIKGKIGTMTVVQPIGRFGSVDILDTQLVSSFVEKPKGDGSWVNGGFFVFEPEFFNYIMDDSDILEKGPLVRLVDKNELVSYYHNSFWKPMDTLREKRELEQFWIDGAAPWKVWND